MKRSREREIDIALTYLALNVAVFRGAGTKAPDTMSDHDPKAEQAEAARTPLRRRAYRSTLYFSSRKHPRGILLFHQEDSFILLVNRICGLWFAVFFEFAWRYFFLIPFENYRRILIRKIAVNSLYL